MGVYDSIKFLCDKQGIAVTQLEKKLGFGRGSIGKMRKSNPSGERIKKIAEYFDVPVDFIYEIELGQPLYATPEQYKSDEYDRYYLNSETAMVAQAVFKDPNLRLLFDAAEDCSPDQVLLAAEMLKKFKEGR